MEYTADLKSAANWIEGSNPSTPTNKHMMLQFVHSGGIVPEVDGPRTLTLVHDGKSIWMRWIQQ